MVPYLFEDAPLVSRAQVRANNALLGYSWSLPTHALSPFIKEDVLLQVVSVGVVESQPHFAANFIWLHPPTQKKIKLSLESSFAISLVEAALGGTGPSISRPLSDAEVGILSAMLLSVCDQMELPLMLLSSDTTSSFSGVSIVFSLAVGARQGRAVICIEPGVFQPMQIPKEVPSWAKLTPKVARLCIGKANFTQEEFSSLLPSDTIIPDELTCDEFGKGLGQIRVDSLMQEVSIVDWQATTQGSWMEEKQTMGATVELSIELGRVAVRLQELSSWKPGSIVPIGHAPGDPVHLVSNGKVVAHGEIVRIENELGVRLTWIEK